LNPDVRLQSATHQRHNGRSLLNREQYVRDIRSITIDLDDTLWAIHPVIARAESCLRDWLAEHYPRVVEQFSSDSMRRLRERVELDNVARAHDLGYLRHEVLRHMSASAGYGKSLVDEAFAVFDDARNDVQIFPDVLPALESLREHYVIVALTNGNANLEKIGISELFDDVVTAVSVGAAKPDRRIFDAAVHAGGYLPRETLHVGDDPQLDIDAARQAGLRTAWMNRFDHEWPAELDSPDTEINQVGSLVRVLQKHRQ
jgi:putative hydrolase of the HAD superfamily